MNPTVPVFRNPSEILLPSDAIVYGLPNTTAYSSHIISHGLTNYSRRSNATPSPERTYITPFQSLKKGIFQLYGGFGGFVFFALGMYI